MSLDSLDQKIEAVRAQAARIQTNITVETAAIEKDQNLSPAGRQEAVNTLKNRSKESMTALRAEETRIATEWRDSLRRSVMGTVGSDSASIISYRDAQDRASRLESSDDAAKVMDRALTSGDTTLARAVAEVALSNGYRDVYASYANANPSTANQAKDLADLERYFNNGGMARALAYMV
jgi:protein required for attachment to host cells